MDAWRYGIYLLVFTFDISLVRYRYEHSKINSISPRDHVLFSIYFQSHPRKGDILHDYYFSLRGRHPNKTFCTEYTNMHGLRDTVGQLNVGFY